MNTHPTQIFLHNPQALRAEYRLDDFCLELWWSPLAGKSFAARDRNFSNRDNHLCVFERIEIPGCGLDDFLSCEYDPYHTVIFFRHRELHLSPHPQRAAILVWSDQPLIVDFKTSRYDRLEQRQPHQARVRHDEPGGSFVFGLRLGPGDGAIRYSPIHTEWNSHYLQANAVANQGIEISTGLSEDQADALDPSPSPSPSAWLRDVEAVLTPETDLGKILAANAPDMEWTRNMVVRGLHSMIDESGAFRASLKAIYYLIWVRDAAFAFHYAASAGWPHKLRELCDLLLTNPTVAKGDYVPPGRMFAQLINPHYGKYEEDGLYYVVLTLFNYWTLTGDRQFFQGEHRELLQEALAWVEAYCFDAERGLFGGFFADETPALGSRDYGWDFAIGKPSGDEHIAVHGQPVVRSYDIYLNTLMHSTYVMLAAGFVGEEGRHLLTKAEKLEAAMQRFFEEQPDGLPWYGELLCADGSLVKVPAWGPVSSVFVWALALPGFLHHPHREKMLSNLLDRLLEHPQKHWINGLCASAAALDPWFHGEDRQLRLLKAVVKETERPGKYLPMGGAMPEKFGARDGDFYHDIRPQGFAMGTWLGAWSGLGVRRLPHGLAVRPTQAFTHIEKYVWREKTIDFYFGPEHKGGTRLAMEINGISVRGTLQIPETTLTESHNIVRLVSTPAPSPRLWIRSTVSLHSVETNRWRFEAFGLAEISIEGGVEKMVLVDDAAKSLSFVTEMENSATIIRFSHWGLATLSVENTQ